MMDLFCLHLLLYVSDGICNCLDIVTRFIVWYLDIKLLLKIHYQFDNVKRVRSQIVLEVCRVNNLLKFNAKFFCNDFLYFIFQYFVKNLTII